MAIQMELSRILVRENAQAHVVELREVNGDRVVPIIIGQNEIAAIERRLMGRVPPRPMTHELLGNLMDALGATLEQVLINDLQEQTFFARLLLRQGDQTIHLDCRPSDALALAACGDVPIYVASHVIEQATIGDASLIQGSDESDLGGPSTETDDHEDDSPPPSSSLDQAPDGK